MTFSLLQFMDDYIVAIATFIGVLYAGLKTRTEVAKMRDEMNPAGSAVTATRWSITVERIDRRLTEVISSLGGIRDDARLDRADVRALGESVTARINGITTRLDRIEAKVGQCPQHGPITTPKGD